MADLARLQVYKVKQRTGRIERYLSTDGRSAVCRGFFKRESDFSAFIGMKVSLAKSAVASKCVELRHITFAEPWY